MKVKNLNVAFDKIIHFYINRLYILLNIDSLLRSPKFFHDLKQRRGLNDVNYVPKSII